MNEQAEPLHVYLTNKWEALTWKERKVEKLSALGPGLSG